MGKKLIWFVIIFWTGITLAFDTFTCLPAIQQAIALSYSSTPGTIVFSQVTTNEGDEATTYGVAFRYTYAADSRDYVGSRYRYGKWDPNDSDWAFVAVGARPVGSRVTIYFNARNPEDSLLLPGLDGSDLFMVAFMTPFNFVMLYLWWLGWSRVRRFWGKPSAGGVKIVTTVRKTRVRLTQCPALGTAAIAVGCLCIVACLIVGLWLRGARPSVHVMTLTWALILGGGVVAGLWHQARILRGKYDLILDELAGTLELPTGFGRKTCENAAYSDVRDVYVETFKKSSGDSEQTVYAPTLRIPSRRSASYRLVEWYDSEKAEEFAEWLRGRLRRENPSRDSLGKS